ncbi:MAG: ArnT family glycosyltransferase [Solirubrobacterales bacterium]
MRSRLRRRAPSPFALALTGVLALAFGLRLWGIKHGLPFVYNVDEASNFVPTAVGYHFTDSYNPHYFINPPAFSYLLHVVLGTWFGGGWPFGAGDEVGTAFATDPTAVFVASRATSAVLGTAAVGFVCLTGARLFDRRVGLVAGAVMAVAFLPVFYSHLALNDVPALLPLAVSAYGSAGVLTRGRPVDYAVAGAGLGLAAATKYTAGIVALPLVVACGSQLLADRRAALRGMGLAGALAAACFVLANPHSLLSFDEFWADVRKQEEAASGFAKLGLDYDSGVLYYLWVLTWGLGWVPLAAAVAGAVRVFAEDLRRALFLVPWPVVFLVYMGAQERFFGRWLLPAFPALALLAGLAVVRAVDALDTRPRACGAVSTTLVTALIAQGLFYSVHVDRVLSRDDTRNEARAWMAANVPAQSKVVVEPIVPDAWFADPDVHDARTARARGLTRSGRRWVKFATGRTTLDALGRKIPGGKGRDVSIEDYERTLRPALVGSYARGGYCWVVSGSTQYGRAFADPGAVPNAIAYYRTLARHADVARVVTPYGGGDGAVAFNFDWSFNHYPRAYDRPGPTVVIQRLRAGACADGGSSDAG